jgi:hypothetical protein
LKIPGISQDKLRILALILKAKIREMENIRRGPTFGEFATIVTEGSMQDNMVAKLARLQSKESPLPLLM